MSSPLFGKMRDGYGKKDLVEERLHPSYQC
jgi:hypothetical protein